MDGLTGIVVPSEDATALAAALDRLIRRPDLRDTMGLAGRRHALLAYDWRHCVDIMESLYLDMAAGLGADATRPLVAE